MKERKMKKTPNKEISLWYKIYLYTSLALMCVLVTVMYFMLLDIRNLNKAYKKSQEDLVYMTTKTLEYKMLLAENKELLRIRNDLQKVLP